MKNTGLMTFGTLGAILLCFIAPLVAWLNKDKLAPEENAVITSLFNFEISLFIVCFLLNFIPLVGQLASLALWVVNIAFCIMAYIAAKDNKPFKAFTFYQFIK